MTVPVPDPDLPLDPTPLSELIEIRPPWSWSNLTEDEAHALDAALTTWVVQYNDHLTTDVSHVIPACWRQHPALAQNLPVLYWAWWAAHRNAAAAIWAATEFHGRYLPGFHQRLDGLLGGTPNASKCRGGRHEDKPNTDQARFDAVNRAAAGAAGPDVIDVLIGTTFGC
jgi:hypothetical protein